MKIEIINRFTGTIVLSGEYESIKGCLENNHGADLHGANLHGANLYGADLHGADLHGADLSGAYLYGADLSGADLSGAYLCGANLYGADLNGANLYGAYLYGADLHGADLSGARGYEQSHNIFAEVVRRQPVSLFVDAEWAAIAQITIHYLCWDAIKKRFSKVMPGIFTKLAEAGFPGWLKYWEKGQNDRNRRSNLC